jgi:hypothetical protein
MKTLIYKILFISTLAAVLLGLATSATATTTVEVYKSPTCGCCDKWVDHMRDNGFTVNTKDVGNKEIRAESGISTSLSSCHTALIDGYAFEGHIPAQDIKRFLRERPRAVGLAVPDMPHGTPGMEGARSDPYNVLLIKKRDDSRRETTVYNRYDPYAKKKAQPVPADSEPTQGGSVMRLK